MMQLAILVTNTDSSDFARAHQSDGEKFTSFIQRVRPDWVCRVYQAKDGVFPSDITIFDGVIVTGGPASVHDNAPWVDWLMEVIGDAYRARVPLFGASFGHQAIAAALGGRVTRNPDGYGYGLSEISLSYRPPWMVDLPNPIALYGAHAEQVSRAPDDARTVLTARDCEIAGFAISDRVYTTQHHPEMGPTFFAALTDEIEARIGPDIAHAGRASMTRLPDMLTFSESVATFFEQAHAQ